ncbi:MAG TPA: preprotein translocase subunit YajC [Candidatus Cloacimonetes bacterium]|nr:preprotein translocase subunit YajC [Candidatus Cloacimonadota bacterium]
MYNVLLEATPSQGGGMQMIIMFGLMFAIIYFLIIRPQKKKQKEHQAMLDSLKVHDNVITSGGIFGKVVNFKKEKTIVVIRVDETTNTKIEVQRAAIAGIISEATPQTNTTK